MSMNIHFISVDDWLHRYVMVRTHVIENSFTGKTTDIIISGHLLFLRKT